LHTTAIGRVRATTVSAGIALALVLTTLGLTPPAAVPARAAAAASAPTAAQLGTAPEYAAGSCWEIKQERSAAPSGPYWLLTPRMTQPERLYCDQTTDGGGWVLVGKGRNGWTMDDAGTGDPSALTTLDYAGGADTHQLPARLVDQLLNGGRVTDLSEGIRVRRALTTSGSRWQEVRFRLDTRQTGWSWALGAQFSVGSWSFSPSSATDSSTVTGSGGTSPYFGTGSSWARVRTTPTALSGWTAGFAYGDSATGSTSGSSYLWSSTTGGGQALPVAQVFLRPRVRSTDAGFQSIPDSGTPKLERDAVPASDADVLPWGVTGIAGSSAREGSVEVQELLEAHGRMYVGGNFRYVQRDSAGTGRVEQPFLAAFDLVTGEWVSSFRPVLNEQVRALELSSTGAIIAAGDFTSANGSPATAVVALDPDTGATDRGFQLTMENRLTGGVLRVWALERLGGDLYLGGEFTHLKGGTSSAFSYMRALGRVRLSDGKTFNDWNPEMSGAVVAIDASDDGTRLYAAGFFNTSRGLPTRKAAAVLTTFVTRPDGSIQHLAEPTWAPVWSSTTADYQQAIVEVGGTVWSGGSEHSIFGFDRSTFQRTSTTILHAKGDIQAMTGAGGILYAASHANNQFAYTGATTWSGSGPGGSPWTSAHTQHWIGAYDATTGRALSDFAPALEMRSGAGVWASTVDSLGRLWVGGDIVGVRSVRGGRFSGGFARYSKADAAAPATPANLRIDATTASSLTLAWNGVTDPSGVTYQLLRNDRPVATTTQTRVTVPAARGEQARYFVRAADGAGNISASTPVFNAVVPGNQPPAPTFTVERDRLTATFDARASTDPDGTITGYAWVFGDGTSGSGAVVQHTYAAAGTYQVTVTATDNEGATATATQSVAVDQTAGVSLVAENAAWTWRYENGSPGTSWNRVGFDASSWHGGGQAPLGWAPSGAPQPATWIDTYAAPSQRTLAAYFRKTFDVADPARLQRIVVRGIADDGAVFYVNGVEVGRQNMPAGTVTYQTYASTSRRLAVAQADPFVLEIPASLLVPGQNVVAAETHLNYRATPDLTFWLSIDAELLGP
jgi:chitodextrinase